MLNGCCCGMFVCYVLCFLFITCCYAMFLIATCCLCHALFLLCFVLLCFIAYVACMIHYMYVYTSYTCSHKFVKCFSRYKRRMLVLELAFAIFCFYKRLRYVFGLNIAFYMILALFWYIFPCGISSSLVDEMYICFLCFGKFYRSSHAKEVLPKFSVNFGL